MIKFVVGWSGSSAKKIEKNPEKIVVEKLEGAVFSFHPPLSFLSKIPDNHVTSLPKTSPLVLLNRTVIISALLFGYSPTIFPYRYRRLLTPTLLHLETSQLPYPTTIHSSVMNVFACNKRVKKYL